MHLVTSASLLATSALIHTSNKKLLVAMHLLLVVLKALVSRVHVLRDLGSFVPVGENQGVRHSLARQRQSFKLSIQPTKAKHVVSYTRTSQMLDRLNEETRSSRRIQRARESREVGDEDTR